jgi:flavin-dependent dehydrogenase
MSSQQYDVVIVGGSFGGTVAGKVAAEKGLNTLIVERASVPGEKIISGAALNPVVFLDLPWVKEGPFERPLHGGWTHFMKHGQVQTSVLQRLPIPVAYTLYCRPFVTWMAEQAVEAGATLMTSTVVTDVIKERGFIKGIVTETGEEIRSDIVIAADGMWSLIGIKAGIRKKFAPEDIFNGVWYDFEMPSKEALDEALGGNEEYAGMSWWDPAGEMLGTHGVVGFFGIAAYKTSFHFGMGMAMPYVADQRIDFDKLYEQFFQHDYWKTHFSQAKLRTRMWRPYPLYCGLERDMKGNDRTTGNGMMVIGDAAGFEPAGTGMGIHTAMLSGKMAAEVAADAISKGDTSDSFLKRYEEMWKSSLIYDAVNERTRRDLTRYAGDEAQMKRNILEISLMGGLTAVF